MFSHPMLRYKQCFVLNGLQIQGLSVCQYLIGKGCFFEVGILLKGLLNKDKVEEVHLVVGMYCIFIS